MSYFFSIKLFIVLFFIFSFFNFYTFFFLISLSLILFIHFYTILLGFRYLASSIPIISLAGVAIGVGLIFSGLIFAICRNPVISNILIRWASIGFSLVEISGFIGLVYSFLILYAFSFILSFQYQDFSLLFLF
jgi:F-type H+-transporting ATPase subunit c